MRPGSLLGILLDLVSVLAAPGQLPADARVGAFFRERRYLGARDRRLLAGLAYGWVRHRTRGEERWDAWAARAGLRDTGSLPVRESPVAALLALARDGLLPWSFPEILQAARELLPPAPSPWAEALERAQAPEALGPRDWPTDPLRRRAAEMSLPPWMAERLLAERGEEEARALAEALLVEAPVDLRVNVSRTSREEARKALENEPGAGPVELTPWSPQGLRLARRVNLGRFQAEHPGWTEVQDEGSQLVVLSAAAPPGGVVIDACAGAGGKTLAFLDLLRFMGGKGRVHACDVLEDKLEELRRRWGRSGGGLELHPLAPEGPLPASLPAHADLVLVDAPCSGSGTLRRNPDLKHRWTPEDLARFAALQEGILRRFAPRVRPGGRLVYATCSIFREENAAVVERFLASEPGFREVPSSWARERLPPAAAEGPRLRLDPVRTGTDGYFVAFLERTG